MYRVNINIYETSNNDKDRKSILVNEKPVYLSVGMYMPIDEELSYSLLIDAHYSKTKSETLTANVPELDSFGPYIAINPDIKNKEIINKLKELNIISDTISTSSYNQRDYEIVKVNIEELKAYKPFGDTVLKDIKEKEQEISY
ncbi:MAG: hypothetical protein Q4G04_06825 [bacterium]|nr:hypothetical protein [bacterium]